MKVLEQTKEKIIFRWVMAVSVIVLIAVIILNRKILPRPDPIPAFASFLPMLNAVLNATCSVLLITSFRAIKRKDVQTHKKLNIITFLLSSLFLISYVTYHWLADETRFPLLDPLRPLYLTILISHIILAAIVLPLVLISFYYGLTNQVKKHRKLVRFTFPIWLYVTVTGVIVYIMISPYYPN